MQKARGQALQFRRIAIALPQLVSVWFQVLLTPLIGVLFIFRSRYFSTIGCRVVLSLREWSPRIRTEFHGLRATLEHWHNGGLSLLSTGLSPSTAQLSS